MPFKSVEDRKAYERAYYRANREKILSQTKANHDTDQKAAYDLKNREAALKRNRSYRSALQQSNPALYMWKNIRARALNENTYFDIAPSDIVVPEFFPVFPWIKLEFSAGRPSEGSPSLDRIDASLGYVKGNIQVISYKANTIKNNATLAELILLTEYMKKVTSNEL